VNESHDPPSGRVDQIVSPSGALQWSAEAGVEWASPAMARMLGRVPGALAGTSLDDHVHAADLADLMAALQAARAGGRAEAVLSIRLVHADGHAFWAEVYLLPAAPQDPRSLLLIVRRVEEEMQAVEMLNRRTREQVSLLRLLQDLLQQRDLQTILTTAAEQARLLLRARDCTLLLLQPDGKTIRAVAAAGEDAPRLLSRHLLLGEGLTGWVVEHGVPQRVDVSADERHGLLQGELAEAGSVLCGPLVHGEHTMGALLLRGAPGAFNDSDLEFLAGLGQVASLAIANSRVFDEVQRRATLDDLTGVFNGGFLAGNLPAEINLGQRLGHGVGVLLASIERRDGLTDAAGHSVGDALLVTLVQAVRRIIRDTDWMAHRGGQDLAVVLPGCPAGQLGVIARRIQDEFSSAASGLAVGQPSGISLSIGGSVYPECTPDPNGLLQDAEAALRDAVRQGGGGVAIRPPHLPPAA
jgi:diguanylate cyclase (GGDEF)-like protein